MKNNISKKISIVDKKRVIILFSVLLTVISIFSISANADSKSKRIDPKYNKACEEALKSIQPLNQEELDVYIGNILMFWTLQVI